MDSELNLKDDGFGKMGKKTVVSTMGVVKESAAAHETRIRTRCIIYTTVCEGGKRGWFHRSISIRGKNLTALFQGVRPNCCFPPCRHSCSVLLFPSSFLPPIFPPSMFGQIGVFLILLPSIGVYATLRIKSSKLSRRVSRSQSQLPSSSLSSFLPPPFMVATHFPKRERIQRLNSFSVRETRFSFS